MADFPCFFFDPTHVGPHFVFFTLYSLIILGQLQFCLLYSRSEYVQLLSEALYSDQLIRVGLNLLSVAFLVNENLGNVEFIYCLGEINLGASILHKSIRLYPSLSALTTGISSFTKQHLLEVGPPKAS